MELSIRYLLFDLVKYFLKLGAIGFGGPVALVAHMHRDLVEQKNGFLKKNIKKDFHWRNAGGFCIYNAVLFNGAGPWLFIGSIRWNWLDPGGLLWSWCNSNGYNSRICRYNLPYRLFRPKSFYAYF